ncbi:amidase [Longivirga aurantiaca]|uniref:Amidase n=1 Tax=Longivirga aurantiaca TaxID=1837743 RepID=A0ABW1SWC3_9ACTN
MSISDITAWIREGRMSVGDVVATSRQRMADHRDSNHYTSIDDAVIERQVRIAENGDPERPLHGVPVAIKDLIDEAGYPTTAGVRAGQPLARRDALVVRRLRQAGAITMGRTNLDQLALAVTGENPDFGTIANPRAVGCIAGGSSGGSAATVALGDVPVALGTDTGGSIRIPSALCGVVGLKGTYGLVPTEGVHALAWSMDTVGPIGRTVDDVRRVFEVIAARSYASPRGIEGLRFSILVGQFAERVSPAIAEAVRQAGEALADRGARLVDLPEVALEGVDATRFIIVASEAAAAHQDKQALVDQAGKAVRDYLAEGASISAVDYLRAQRSRRRIISELSALVANVDFVIMPTVASTAIPTLELMTEKASDRRIRDRYVRLCSPWNLTGHPALTVPFGSDESGLPMGIQLVADYFHEGALFAAGTALESARASAAPSG